MNSPTAWHAGHLCSFRHGPEASVVHVNGRPLLVRRDLYTTPNGFFDPPSTFVSAPSCPRAGIPVFDSLPRATSRVRCRTYHPFTQHYLHEQIFPAEAGQLLEVVWDGSLHDRVRHCVAKLCILVTQPPIHHIAFAAFDRISSGSTFLARLDAATVPPAIAR